MCNMSKQLESWSHPGHTRAEQVRTSSQETEFAPDVNRFPERNEQSLPDPSSKPHENTETKTYVWRDRRPPRFSSENLALPATILKDKETKEKCYKGPRK